VQPPARLTRKPQYAVHKSATGDIEQAPLRKIGLMASDS